MAAVESLERNLKLEDLSLAERFRIGLWVAIPVLFFHQLFEAFHDLVGLPNWNRVVQQVRSDMSGANQGLDGIAAASGLVLAGLALLILFLCLLRVLVNKMLAARHGRVRLRVVRDDSGSAEPHLTAKDASRAALQLFVPCFLVAIAVAVVCTVGAVWLGRPMSTWPAWLPVLSSYAAWLSGLPLGVSAMLKRDFGTFRIEAHRARG